MKYKSFFQFELPLMIWFLITSLSDPIFTFLSFHLEYTSCTAIYKTHQLLITLLCLLRYALFYRQLHYYFLKFLMTSKLYSNVTFYLAISYSIILIHIILTYTSTHVQTMECKISRSDCSLYCSFIYQSTCNPINSRVHSIKYIYFCTL